MDKAKALSLSNSSKSKAGADWAKVINSKLNQLENQGSIKSFKIEQNCSHREFEYKKQFLANYLIETFDGKFIVVRSSTSFRSDRVKTGFYDLDGINNHATFSKYIIASIYLVPDSELKNTTYISTRKKFLSKEYYSPATHILTLSEFIEFLEGYNYSYIESDSKEEASDVDTLSPFLYSNNDHQKHFLQVKEQGSYYGRAGNQLEKHLAELLSDGTKLVKLKKNELPDSDFFKVIILKIASSKNIPLDDIINVQASNSIVLLQRGGNAKTDIRLNIDTIDNQKYIETISVKNSTRPVVSCHDYTANDFIRVMKCEKTVFADYFLLFQKHPTYKDFEKNLSNGQSIKEFQEILLHTWPKFGEWVLMGKHDHENIVDPETQISMYLFILDPNNKKFSFYTMEEYLKLILAKKPGKFGVPFSWTYPSKQRGKRIQLKMPIIHG